MTEFHVKPGRKRPEQNTVPKAYMGIKIRREAPIHLKPRGWHRLVYAPVLVVAWLFMGAGILLVFPGVCLAFIGEGFSSWLYEQGS